MNSFIVTECADCRQFSEIKTYGAHPHCKLAGQHIFDPDTIPDECPKLIINRYRLATKDDIGTKCYFSDMSMKDAVSSENTVHEILKKVNKDCFVENRGVGWRFAFIKKEIV